MCVSASALFLNAVPWYSQIWSLNRYLTLILCGDLRKDGWDVDPAAVSSEGRNKKPCCSLYGRWLNSGKLAATAPMQVRLINWWTAILSYSRLFCGRRSRIQREITRKRSNSENSIHDRIYFFKKYFLKNFAPKLHQYLIAVKLDMNGRFV